MPIPLDRCGPISTIRCRPKSYHLWLFGVVTAEREIDEGLKLGCGTFRVPATPAGGKSPSHHDYDGVWARLQNASVPFMVHVGAGETSMPDEYRNNDRGPITDYMGGARISTRKLSCCSTRPPRRC
jgi:hypothetical protein